MSSDEMLAKNLWTMWVQHHDTDAKAHRQDVKDTKESVKKLEDKMDTLMLKMPCSVHIERMLWLERMILWCYAYTTASLAGVIAWVQWAHSK